VSPMPTSLSESRAAPVRVDSRKEEVLSAEVRLLYANANVALGVTILAATVLGLLQRRTVPNPVVVGWWLYMVLVSVSRTALAWRYRFAVPECLETRKWLTSFTVGAGLAGVGWGGAGIILYPENHLTNQVLLVFVVGGMMLGAVSLLAPRPEAFLAFLIPAGVGPAFRLGIQGGGNHLVMGLLAAVFTLATLIMTRRIHRTIDSSLCLQFENRDLLANLQTEIVERREAEQALRELSGRLLQAQDQERRRLARELHDGTSQTLNVMQLCAWRLQNLILPDGSTAQVTLFELLNLIDRCGSEIRTLSHLLHPPFLEVAGLGAAIRAYAEGFGERSGIAVTCDFPSDLPRFSPEVETALFRVTQEAVANVHRHSGSKTAHIRATVAGERIRLEIKDQGHGIPAGVLGSPSKLGVGIRGMTERLRLLSGELSIESNERGTTVRAELPTTAPVAEHLPKVEIA